MALDPEGLQPWREEMALWVERHGGDCLAIHDFDADGLCAAALWQRAFPAGRCQVVPSRHHLGSVGAPQLVFLLDVGPPEQGLAWNIPTVVIDHHPPLTAPDPDRMLMLNVHHWRPPACTSLLAHWLFFGDHSPHAWIAAVGALSDLGDSHPCSLFVEQLRTWGISRLRQVASLVNAAHRSEGDCGKAMEALMQHESPQELLHSRQDSVLYLRSCQEKVRERLKQAKASAPRFFGRLALIEIRSDCPVQSLVAQIWRSRLNRYFILVANHREDRDCVQISGRCGQSQNIIREMAGRGLVLRGHPSSAGAVLSPTEWRSFLETLHEHRDQRSSSGSGAGAEGEVPPARP